MPGLTEGRKLKPEQLDSMSECARRAGAVDLKMRSLVADMVAFNDAIIAGNAEAAADLRSKSSSALIRAERC